MPGCRREGSQGAALPAPGCRMGRGLRSCRFGTVAVALEGRREGLGSEAHSALLESCGVTDRTGMSWCPAEMLSGCPSPTSLVFNLFFIPPTPISFLAVPHPASKTPWNGFALRHKSGAVGCSKKVPREELAGSARLQHHHHS